MNKNNIIRFVQSLVLLPVMTSMSIPGGNLLKVVSSQVLLSQKFNTEVLATLALNQAEEAKTKTIQAQADAINAYFGSRNLPLEGTGLKMALEAEKNGIDWRLLPAIAMRESTGGKFACKKVTHSFFGWGSCEINFKSDKDSIEIVAKNLGGNNPNTARHYANKSTKEILLKYNPPSVVLHYADQVIKIMNSIGDETIVTVEV